MHFKLFYDNVCRKKSNNFVLNCTLVFSFLIQLYQDFSLASRILLDKNTVIALKLWKCCLIKSEPYELHRMVSEELWNKILTCNKMNICAAKKDLQDVWTAKAASKTAITAKTVCNTMEPVKTANYRCVFIKKYDLDQHWLSNPPSTQIKQYHNHSYFFINDRNCNM